MTCYIRHLGYNTDYVIMIGVFIANKSNVSLNSVVWK